MWRVQFPKILQIAGTLLLFFSAAPAMAQEYDDKPGGPYAEASQAMRNKEYYRAAQLYRGMLKKTPEDVSLQQLLCHALILNKDFMEADSILQALNEADTNNAGNYWYMGISAERQAKDSVAAVCFKKYLGKTEGSPSQKSKGWLYAGSAWRRLMHTHGISLAQTEDLIYCYQTYLSRNPTDPFGGALQKFIDQLKARKPEAGSLLIWDETN